MQERCTLVPAIGKVTIAMLERNLLRLHANFHTGGSGRWPLGAGRVHLAIAAAAAVAIAALLSRR